MGLWESLYGLSSVIVPGLLALAILWFASWHARDERDEQ